MNHPLSYLALLVLALGLLGAQLHAAGQAETQAGRYEGIAAAANAVWVIDTHSGKVRRCVQDFADQAPNCSAMSN
jgi:hypothetical protein